MAKNPSSSSVINFDLLVEVSLFSVFGKTTRLPIFPLSTLSTCRYPLSVRLNYYLQKERVIAYLFQIERFYKKSTSSAIHVTLYLISQG